MILPDAEAAWYHGVRSARDIIQTQFASGSLAPGQRFEIEDDQGEPIWALPFEEVVGLSA